MATDATKSGKTPKPRFDVEEDGQIDQFLAYLKEQLLTNDLTLKVNLRPKKACAKNCRVKGPGLDGGEVDIPGQFDIEARDNTDKPLTHGDSPFEVAVIAPSGSVVPHKLIDNGNGTYAVAYTPTEAGPHSVAVNLNGEKVGKSPFAVAIEPPTPDPTKSDVTGPGIENATVAAPAPVIVRARNRVGAPLKVGGHPFVLSVSGPHGDAPSKLIDNGDGTYSGVYTPLDPGKHKVAVTLNGTDIVNSPSTVEAAKSPLMPDASKCFVVGDGVGDKVIGTGAGPQTGKPKVLGQGHGEGEAPTSTEVSPTSTAAASSPDVVEPASASSKDTPASDRNRRQPASLGEPSPHKDHDGSGGKAPEFEDLPPPPGGIHAPGPTTARPALFTVQAVGPNGEKLPTGGSPFEAEVRDPDGEPVPCNLVDNNDGTYSGQYQPLKAGPHEVEVVLRHHVHPLFFEHVKNSPFVVDVQAGIDATKCECYGPGLEDGVVDTLPTHFTIKVKNIKGEDIAETGLPFIVTVAGPTGTGDVPCTVSDNGDGTYHVAYEPHAAGEHTVQVSLKDIPVGKSPYHVQVKKGCDFNTTCISGFTFSIDAKTKDGQPLKVGGEDFVVSISGKKKPASAESAAAEEIVQVEGIEVKDNTDGSYLVSYHLPAVVVSSYDVSVMLNGHHIQGSPLKMVFE
ncbi:gelation factor [Pelomyxa schiedti]|nr:gelation factor [Pelomyxa schiedti]